MKGDSIFSFQTLFELSNTPRIHFSIFISSKIKQPQNSENLLSGNLDYLSSLIYFDLKAKFVIIFEEEEISLSRNKSPNLTTEFIIFSLILIRLEISA